MKLKQHVLPEEKKLRSVYHFDLPKPIFEHLERGLVGMTAQDGIIGNVSNVYRDPLFDSTNDTITGFKTETSLTVPIFGIDEEIVYVIQILNRNDVNLFSEQDIECTKLFGTMASHYLKFVEIENDNISKKISTFIQSIKLLPSDKSSIEIQNLIENCLKESIRCEKVLSFSYNQDIQVFKGQSSLSLPLNS
jgi:hypothetical protein